ncbi:glycosyltransferase family 61 protein [Haloarchaeobius amylolyticus]|uniref:glycosyltransferase family 61 protein n=1 Tax=Haloarchaeobius amylolyticus TaxID=1198296 RepID=UPI00226F0CAB|nr:glycosyltransferase family 61 protein [Haloarchaeobius amylolyticus]
MLRRLYRRARPELADAYRRLLGSRLLTRDELLANPPEGCRVFNFGAVEQYTFNRPRHTGPLPNAIAAKVGEWTVPKPFVAEITDATVIGPSPLVTVDKRILLESTRGTYPRLLDSSVRALAAGQLPVQTRFQRPTMRYDDPLFLFVGPWATEYFHWITDYLVKVFSLEAYCERTGVDPLVLIPSDPPSWVLDSLSLAGIGSDRLREWSGGRAQAHQIIIGSARYRSSPKSGEYIYSPAALKRLGERIRSAVTTNMDEGGRRLYVSRSDAPNRRVQNETDLLTVLDQYGFERFVPGEHSFEEQVRRFAEAETILGPHGAGLTNMIFSTDAKIIELFGSYENACFFTLARGIGFDYVSVSCESDGSDIVVNPKAVKSLLAELLSQHG